MKTSNLLKTFSHSFYPAAYAPAEVSVKDLNGAGFNAHNNTSSLTTEIDFEKGNFMLEGDWNFIMNCNRHAQPEWLNVHKNRVVINGSIYPSFSIDLNDSNNDGAVFILEGNISDADNTNTCSGLLVLDKVMANTTTAVDTWNISIYLYENDNEDCEIAFKLPLLVGTSIVLAS